MCERPSKGQLPAQTARPGENTNRALGETASCVGNPINPGTGLKYQIEVDYRSTSGLEFKRIYNSYGADKSPSEGFFGIGGWRLEWHQSIQGTATVATAYVVRGDGKAYTYNLVGSAWQSDADINGQLTRQLSTAGSLTGWQYKNAQDEVETYNASGRLVSITDPVGQTTTLAYSDGTASAPNGGVIDGTTTALPVGLLIRITDPHAHTLSLGYDAQSRIVKMTDPAGGVYTYAYDANSNLSSVTYPDGKSKQYLYENTTFTRALTGIVDENSNRYATYTYDSTGRAISTEHANGADKVILTYNTDGTTSITDALGTTRTQTYQVVQGVVKSGGMNQPGGSGCGAASNNLAYDANGNVSSRTDFNGNKVCYAYDLARNLETIRLEGLSSNSTCPADLVAYVPSTAAGSVARKTTTQWHPSLRLPTTIAEPLRLTSYTYDTKGNLLTRTAQPTGDATGAQGLTAPAAGTPRITSHTYNAAGQVLTLDGPRTDANDITQYAYDAQGNLATVTNALNQLTTLGSYDANGRVGTLTDPNGLATYLTYDARGRLTSRSTGGEITRYSYDGAGQLISVSAPAGATYSYSYDAAHRLTGITDGLGNRISYTLDAMGNRTREQLFDAAGTIVQSRSRSYDALNRLYQDIGAINQITTYTYDANGNLTTVSDPLNRQTVHSYDALNRLIGSTDAANGITRYGYDALDQLTQVTDPRNLTTRYTRDGLNNLTQQTSPDTGLTAHTYDAAGNLLTRTDAKGQIARYSYDALNRLTGISYAGAPAQTVSYQYDQGSNGIGRLTGIVDATGTTAYSYDQHGRLTTETAQTHGATYTTAYGYDAQGRLNTITYPSGRTVNHSFDSMGRISRIATSYNGTANILASNIAYQPFGGVQSFTYGDGQTAPVQIYTRQHDQDGRIASYTLNGRALSIGYDTASQIAFISDPGNLANTANYSYDPLSRLTGYTQNTLNQGYSYDADGNRTGQTIGSTTSTYGYAPGSNRLNSIQTGANQQSLTHDANGATISDATRQYGYDARGRLMQTSTAQGIINYEVNALGLRIRKQVPYANTDTLYHYDSQGHLIGESPTGRTQFTREYIYLGDQPVAVLQ